MRLSRGQAVIKKLLSWTLGSHLVNKIVTGETLESPVRHQEGETGDSGE